MSKKKKQIKKVEDVTEVVTDKDSDAPLVITSYTYYVVKLQQDFKEYKKGKSLSGMLLPARIDKEDDKWGLKWYIHDGETFVGFIPKDSDIIKVISTKKGSK